MLEHKEFVMYTTPGCEDYARALDYLKSHGITPTVHVIDINNSSDDADHHPQQRHKPASSETFPQVYADGEFLRGLKELQGACLFRPTEYRELEIQGKIQEPMCHEPREFERFILFNGENEQTYDDIYQIYKKQQALFWVVEEIDMTQDVEHWNHRITDDERHFLTHILAFFASLDQVVMENLGENFGEEIKVAQVRQHFAIQNAMEAIHAETYSMLIQTYIKEREPRMRVLRSIQTMPIIHKKALWASQWMDPRVASLAERLIGFVCLEGIQFSGAFCAIFWLKKRGLFPGMCHANTLISRDEGLHAEAGVAIYRKLAVTLPEARVHEIVRDAVDVETEFVSEALSVELLGINAGSMTQYIQFVADFWCRRIGVSEVYGVGNPFEWMDMISLQGKTNFFEKRVAEYSLANTGGGEGGGKKGTEDAFEWCDSF